MTELLPFIVIGIANGSVYALAGMGLVLTYKTTGIFNFAHGAQAAVAAYLMYTLRVLHGWPWPAAALASLLVSGVIGGVLLERLARALAKAPVATQIVATVGLLIGLQGALVAHYGAATIQFEPFLPTSGFRMLDVVVRVDQVIVTVLAAVAAAALFVFFRRARLGLGMQAVVNNADLLGLRGTSPVTVRRWAWVVGSCFASLSGLLLAPTIGLDATILTLLVVQAFGAAAIGAFTSLVGAYAGGLTIGLGASFATKYVSGSSVLSGLPSTLPFLVLFAVLLLIPRRYLVERRSRFMRRNVSVRTFTPRMMALGTAVGVAALLVVPSLFKSRLPLFTNGLVFVILFASLGLLVRTSGQISLCHMSFAAVGSATFAHLTSAGVPWLLAVVVGGLVAMPVGAIVAIPAIRLSGIYLAVATFGFGILVERIFFRTGLMFGDLYRLAAPRPKLGGLHLGTDTGYYYVLLAVAALSCALVVVTRRARLGRLLRGLADSPDALAAHGTNTNSTLVFVFCISAFLAGIAGAVAGPVTGSATGNTFSFDVSLLLLAVLAIAGRQPVVSAFIAAGLYAVSPGYLSGLQEWLPVVFGTAAILAAVNPWPDVLARLARSPRAGLREGYTRNRARVPAVAGGGAS